MNVAYKHLEDKLRVGEFTFGQWAVITTSAALAMLWGFRASPFGLYPTVISSVYIVGLPAMAAVLAGVSEFDLITYVRAAWRFWRAPGRYIPGAPATVTGYVIAPDPGGAEDRAVERIDLEALWDC